MNSALLLLTACALGSHPVCSTSTCKDCCPASSECCEKEGFLSKLRSKLKCGSGCDTCQIQCPHPGLIPGTEHPTLKQQIKDCVCPCNGCPSDSCGKSWKTSCKWEKHGCGNSCGSCKPTAGLLNRLFGRFSRCKDSCDDCCVQTVTVTPGASPAPKMPKADETKKEQLPLPSSPKKVERIEKMPLRTISQPASPVEYSIPKTLDLGKSPY